MGRGVARHVVRRMNVELDAAFRQDFRHGANRHPQPRTANPRCTASRSNRRISRLMSSAIALPRRCSSGTARFASGRAWPANKQEANLVPPRSSAMTACWGCRTETCCRGIPLQLCMADGVMLRQVRFLLQCRSLSRLRLTGKALPPDSHESVECGVNYRQYGAARLLIGFGRTVRQTYHGKATILAAVALR